MSAYCSWDAASAVGTSARTDAVTVASMVTMIAPDGGDKVASRDGHLAAMAFTTAAESPPAAASTAWGAARDLYAQFRRHPYQHLVVALLAARLLQVLLARRTSRRGGNSKVDTERQRRDRLQRSRLLRGSLPDDLELEEMVEKAPDKRATRAERTGRAAEASLLPPSGSDDAHTATHIESAATEAASPEANPGADDAVPTAAVAAPASPAFCGASDAHPGLDAFCGWFDTEASLFRVYTRGRTDAEVVPPYCPSSRRGTVRVALRVTNGTRDTHLVAYWVDYQGRRVDRGRAAPGATWTQTTWIDHPWVFAEAATGALLLHFVPYRVLPATALDPTTDPDDPTCGLFRFTVLDPAPDDDGAVYGCRVRDELLPYPAAEHFVFPERALDAALRHCLRLGYRGWPTLAAYLSHIVQHPEEPRYRHLRTAQRRFGGDVWQTPARGVLLALGFVERGAAVELGSAAPLPRAWVQDVARLLQHLDQWQRYAERPDAVPLAQPEGADGYGRAGYGRAGQMNS